MNQWQLLAWEFYGNSLGLWLAAVGVAALLFALLRVGQDAGIARLSRLSAKTASNIDNLLVDLLRAIPMATVLVLALWVGATLLALPAEAARLVGAVALIALFFQLGLWGNRLVTFWLMRNRIDRANGAEGMALGVLGFVSRLVVWSVVLLLCLANLGFDVTALVASLGIGGIAIGLAVQNILGDLFASLSIVFDKPFEVGDFIIVGDEMGTVEAVGLKTTRVRSLSGEQLVFSNSDLIDSRIRNYARMRERRVAFTVGVTYQTPPEQLERIPQMIREMIEVQNSVRFDRAHFQGFGDFALNFEIVYFVLSPDYGLYMDIQQAINLQLVKRFAAAGIEFAYPTQSLFIERLGNVDPAPILGDGRARIMRQG